MSRGIDAVYGKGFWNQPCVEPQKRRVGGVYRWAMRRFPIKGGITIRESMIRDMAAPNPLMELVKLRETAE